MYAIEKPGQGQVGSVVYFNLALEEPVRVVVASGLDDPRSFFIYDEHLYVATATGLQDIYHGDTEEMITM